MSDGRIPPNKGTYYALGAYTLWGLFPIYWKWLQDFTPFEIISERILWSFLFYWLLTVWKEGRATEWLRLFRQSSTRRPVIWASLLLTVNWILYVWAVNNGHVLDASLGYFITPLLNVLTGRWILQERLTPLLKTSVGLAALGVAVLVFQAGHVPWIALCLATTFSVYGLLRKRLATSVFQASTAETFIMVVPALIGAVYFRVQSDVSVDFHEWALFIGSGVVTGLPLIWFANAARLLPLSSLGFFQYIAPTLQFLLAIFVYGESFSKTRFLAFAFIWLACGVFSYESLRNHRRAKILRKANL